MQKILGLLLLFCVVGLGTDVYAQGKVSRPSKKAVAKKKTQSQPFSKPDGYINGHGYVDLGLPSGNKWAVCNVGASSPDKAGTYFAWGETHSKSNYTPTTSALYRKSETELKNASILDSQGNLTMAYDAANANMGATWRIPGMQDFKELCECCKWKLTTLHGIQGYKVTGTNGKSIFLPITQNFKGTELQYYGVDGFYWSSTVTDNWMNDTWEKYGWFFVYILHFDRFGIEYDSMEDMSYGVPVRAVSK